MNKYKCQCNCGNEKECKPGQKTPVCCGKLMIKCKLSKCCRPKS